MTSNKITSDQKLGSVRFVQNRCVFVRLEKLFEKNCGETGKYDQ